MLSQFKTRIIGLSRRSKIILIILTPIILCCCLPTTWLFTDVTLHVVGILPTYTPTVEVLEVEERSEEIALENTATPEDTSTPQPTDTSAPTTEPTEEPTNTPRSTSTPNPTNTPRPTSTPKPTNTPRSTNTPPPNVTNQPTIASTQPPQNTDAPTPTQPLNNTPQPTTIPTQAPTAIPQPTQPPTIAPTAPPSAPNIEIINVNKQAEYADIRNNGGTAQDLNGWNLVSERGNQQCPLGGIIEAGATLRIWALSEDAGNGGFNCGFGSPIWNNSESDNAVLYDNEGREVSRFFS